MANNERVLNKAIEYSDRINHEGTTSWSLADAFVAGFDYSNDKIQLLNTKLAEKEKSLDVAIEYGLEVSKKCFELKDQLNANHIFYELKDTQNKYQSALIDLLMNQVADLTMMSKIELGDDVINEINRLKSLLVKGN